MSKGFKAQIPLTCWDPHHATPGPVFRSIVQVSATQNRPVINCTIKLPPSLPTNTCGWNFYKLIFCFGLAGNSAAGSGERWEHSKANRRNTALVGGVRCGRKEEQSSLPGGIICSGPSRRSPATPASCPVITYKIPLWKPVGVVHSVQWNIKSLVIQGAKFADIYSWLLLRELHTD